jgi:hypothetical protein
MPKGCKLVIPPPIQFISSIASVDFIFLSQICFDSLIPTRSQSRNTDTNNVLSYKKLIKVGAGGVSWKAYSVDLHVLERI